jgi:FlaA1/EpsC-like NDP-sugar epimerase/lipopolysaccharide/colanic/teichoic acid biosynthesis glycosyltransferase/predicted RNA-binding Zn-ribbon protein involved in translation (DUF1610 family)
MIKRSLDFLVAVAGLTILSPLLLILLLIVWLQDYKNPFYVAPRVGRNGETFRMFKLRSMVANADKIGGASTAVTDRRITPIGRMLRRFKFDEIPQLINVAAGQMSLVGPRPQVPQDVAKYTAAERHLLDVIPGITDFSSIVFADEGEILRDAEDADAKYDAIIRPWKSRLGLFYVRRNSTETDLWLILLTLVNVFSRQLALGALQRLLRSRGASSDLVHVAGRTEALFPVPPPGADPYQGRIGNPSVTGPTSEPDSPTLRAYRAVRRVFSRNRRVPIVAGHLVVIGFSYYFSFLIRFDGTIPPEHVQAFWSTVAWVVVLRGFTFVPFRLYEGLWRYTSLYDMETLVAGVATSSVILVLLFISPVGPAVYPRSVLLVDGLLLTALLAGVRLTKRIYSEFSLHEIGGSRVLVYGAGNAGELIVREMRQKHYLGLRPIGFIDDDEGKVGASIHGVRVLGTRADISRVVAKYRPTSVIIAMPNADPEAVRDVVRTVESLDVKIKTLPDLRNMIDSGESLEHLRSLTIDDLLPHVPLTLDSDPIRDLVGNRTVMVTGAGGTIGAELSRQIARLRPKRLVLFERHATSLGAIHQELEAKRQQRVEFAAVLGDVTDPVAVHGVLAEHQPEIIFHAATHYGSWLSESDAPEAVRNNVGGTRILASAAAEAGVRRLVLLSTEKAANPTEIVGATLRLAELIVQSVAAESMMVSVVRFGNVLGSPGSVVPKFVEQIRRGGPVTVTHPESRRAFMGRADAVELALHAAAHAKAGVFSLDMGQPIKIVDIARHLIRLTDKVPDEDIEIRFVGLRPAEKIEEDSCGSGESLGASGVPRVKRVMSSGEVPADFSAQVAAIESLAAARDLEGVQHTLRRLVAPLLRRPAAVVAAETSVPAPPAAVREMVEESDVAHQCPKCKEASLHRSKAKTFSERLTRRFSSRRMFRCGACGWRGWLEPLERVSRAGLDPAAAPDLDALDTLTERRPIPAEARPREWS